MVLRWRYGDGYVDAASLRRAWRLRWRLRWRKRRSGARAKRGERAPKPYNRGTSPNKKCIYVYPPQMGIRVRGCMREIDLSKTIKSSKTTLTDEPERSHWSRNDRSEILRKRFSQNIFFGNMFSKMMIFYLVKSLSILPCLLYLVKSLGCCCHSPKWG